LVLSYRQLYCRLWFSHYLLWVILRIGMPWEVLSVLGFDNQVQVMKLIDVTFGKHF